MSNVPPRPHAFSPARPRSRSRWRGGERAKLPLPAPRRAALPAWGGSPAGRREEGRERDGRPQGRDGHAARAATGRPGPPTCGRSGTEQRVAPQLPAPLSPARAGVGAHAEPFPCKRPGQTQTRPPPPPTHRAGTGGGMEASAGRPGGTVPSAHSSGRSCYPAACGAGGTLTPQPCQKHCTSPSRATVILVRERKASWALMLSEDVLTLRRASFWAPWPLAGISGVPLLLSKPLCSLHLAFRVVVADGPGHRQSREWES